MRIPLNYDLGFDNNIYFIFKKIDENASKGKEHITNVPPLWLYILILLFSIMPIQFLANAKDNTDQETNKQCVGRETK